MSRRKKNEPDLKTAANVLKVVGHSVVAPHIMKGCEVILCSECPTLLYVCLPRCESRQVEVEEVLTCSTLYDEHFPLARLMDYEVFSVQQKRAIKNAMIALDIKEK